MIRFFFRWAFRLLVLAIVLAVAAVLLKDPIARSIAEQRIRSETGFDAKISKFEIALFAPTIRVEGFTLYNPAEFGGSAALDIPDMQLEYAKEDLAFGKVRLKLLRLNLRELHVVQNQSGRTNIIDLMSKVAPETLRSGRTNENYSFNGIDVLNLSVGKVRYTSMRFPRQNQEINLGLHNEVIQNIRSEQDLAGLLFKILLRAGITIYLDQKPAPRKAV